MENLKERVDQEDALKVNNKESNVRTVESKITDEVSKDRAERAKTNLSNQNNTHSKENNESLQSDEGIERQPLPITNSNGNVFKGSVSLTNSGIINFGKPTPYRPDCQMGKFKIKSNPISDNLNFTVLAIRNLQGEFFNYEYQDWIELIIVDDKRILSSMLLKTESMDNFGLTTKFILSSGKRLIDVMITGYFVKRRSTINNSNYFVLEFRFTDNLPELVKDIETFLDSCDVTKVTGLNF